MVKKIIIIGAIFFIFLSSNPGIGLAEDLEQGAKIFNLHCSGCHPNGNNIIRRGKTLKTKALKRNKIDSIEAISELVANGKNNMSAFKDRLNPEEIQTVAQYVLKQAQKDWQ